MKEKLILILLLSALAVCPGRLYFEPNPYIMVLPGKGFYISRACSGNKVSKIPYVPLSIQVKRKNPSSKGGIR